MGVESPIMSRKCVQIWLSRETKEKADPTYGSTCIYSYTVAYSKFHFIHWQNLINKLLDFVTARVYYCHFYHYLILMHYCGKLPIPVLFGGVVGLAIVVH